MIRLKEGSLCNITYTKADETVSNRVIIPSHVPSNIIRGIDVTELDQEARDLLLSRWDEYQAYRKQQMSTICSFEQFQEQQFPLHEQPVKWRSFDISRIS